MVSWFAKKKFEKTFIIAKAGKPKLKKYKAFAEFKTELSLNSPYPKRAEIISSDAISKAIEAGKLKNKLSSNAFFLIKSIFFLSFLLIFFDNRVNITIPIAIPAIAKLIW